LVGVVDAVGRGWDEEGLDSDVSLSGHSVQLGAPAVERDGQVADTPPVEQAQSLRGRVRGRDGADGEHQLARAILRVDAVERDEEGADPDAVVVSGVTHRGPPGSDRDIQLADEPARDARTSELADVTDHRCDLGPSGAAEADTGVLYRRGVAVCRATWSIATTDAFCSNLTHPPGSSVR
jgi:hypothetical protein